MSRRFAWVMAVCIGLLFAPPAVQARADNAIRLSGVISESVTPDPACGGLHITATGVLQGIPIGRGIWTGSECVDATREPGAFVIRGGAFMLRAANGTITGVYEGRGGPPSTAGHVYVSGTFKISGGTGAFRRMSGDGLLTADAEPLTNRARIDLAGTLRFRR